MKKYPKNIKKEAVNHRNEGATYSEICQKLGMTVPKSTLSTWCKGAKLPSFYKLKIKGIVDKSLIRARRKSILIKKEKKSKYINGLMSKNRELANNIYNVDVAKIALSILYLGEGGKCENGSLMLGNSDSNVMMLFLKLLRYCYRIDESKFRCTLQCRFDQDVSKLENYWHTITGISKNQFYKAQIDPRTTGKPSKKKNYKGVCRIDYFSADIFWEIKTINQILFDKEFPSKG